MFRAAFVSEVLFSGWLFSVSDFCFYARKTPFRKNPRASANHASATAGSVRIRAAYRRHPLGSAREHFRNICFDLLDNGFELVGGAV
jgi:hypothetical protein